jgi:AcrR family transcriptional regulator
MRGAGRPREAGAARAAILGAADELFYARGCAAVSLEAVAERAGVTRRTLYYHFESKEDLVAAYLKRRDLAGLSMFERAGSILAVFDALERWFRTREFRGCALTNAVGENGETVVVAGPITQRHKRAILAWFDGRARDARVDEHAQLAEQLMLLFDGALTSARTRRDAGVAKHAREAARRLLASYGVTA